MPFKKHSSFICFSQLPPYGWIYGLQLPPWTSTMDFHHHGLKIEFYPISILMTVNNTHSLKFTASIKTCIDLQIPFPPNMVINPLVRDREGTTPAMYWIRKHKTEPPVELRHASTVVDVYGRNLTMFWIKYVKTEPPQWIFGTNLDHGSMRCEATFTDNDNRTPAMYWIKATRTDVPLYLRHSSLMMDCQLMTLSMIWVKYVKTDPPQWMRHNPELRTLLRATIASVWIEYVRTDPPQWMHHRAGLEYAPGYTVKYIWCRCVGYDVPCPGWMIADDVAVEEPRCYDHLFCEHPEKIFDSDCCPICRDDFEDKVLLKCGHAYCKACISNWFDRCVTCPLCGI
jgi:hypothetical protein